MVSSNGEDVCTTDDRRTAPTTNESSPGGTGSLEPRVISAKHLGNLHKGPDGKYHCKPDSKCSIPKSFSKMLGLRRREVHEMHGGPKQMLLCTIPGCPRNSGKQFKRKGNLDDHCRRAHGGDSQLQKIAHATMELVTPAPRLHPGMENNHEINKANAGRADRSHRDASPDSRYRSGDRKSHIEKIEELWEESSAMDKRILCVEKNNDLMGERLANCEERFEEMLARRSVGEGLAPEEKTSERPIDMTFHPTSLTIGA